VLVVGLSRKLDINLVLNESLFLTSESDLLYACLPFFEIGQGFK
jgi:hypothetical protein